MDNHTRFGRPEELLYPVVAEMARRGATRGMIVRKLRDEKVDEFTAGLVADRVLRAVATRRRIGGLGLILAGFAILTVAWFSTAVFPVKIPVVLGMFGLIVLGLGISEVTHRATLPKEPLDFKSRVW